MSDQPSPAVPSIDPAAQRRARVVLAVVLVLLIAAGAGGYFGWKTYQQKEADTLAAALQAEGGLNVRGAVRRLPPNPARAPISAAEAQRFTDEMGKRQEKARANQLEAVLNVYKTTAEAERDAFVDRTVAANRGRWRQIAENPPPSADPAAAEEFLARLRARLPRNATSRPARPPRAAASRPA